MRRSVYWLNLGWDCKQNITTMDYKEKLAMACVMLKDYLKKVPNAEVTLHQRENGITIYARLLTPEKELSLNVSHGYPFPVGDSPIVLLNTSPRGLHYMKTITFKEIGISDKDIPAI